MLDFLLYLTKVQHYYSSTNVCKLNFVKACCKVIFRSTKIRIFIGIPTIKYYQT